MLIFQENRFFFFHLMEMEAHNLFVFLTFKIALNN